MNGTCVCVCVCRMGWWGVNLMEFKSWSFPTEWYYHRIYFRDWEKLDYQSGLLQTSL